MNKKNKKFNPEIFYGMSKYTFAMSLILMVILVACQGSPSGSDTDENRIPEVNKTNDIKVYMHYMPWFESKPYSGYWGTHWTMANKNPDNILENGQREIASHYYPLIGPYDSQDSAVIEYHLLLMKYAGIDGLLIDWYGTHRVNDYYTNLANSNALIDRIDDVGLEFGIVYEEFTAENVGNELGITDLDAAKKDLEYIESKYFGRENYIQTDNSPLLLTFGPRHFRDENQWDEILGVIDEQPKFLPLWGHANYLGKNADGTFSWVDFNASLSQLESYYKNASAEEMVIGSAYPGFHDYYEEGDWGSSYGRVYMNNGQTLQNTLEKAEAHNLDYLQLVTWNDFGEGTMFEPTVEYEYMFLEIIQEYTGVPYSRSELELVHQYYEARKAGNDDQKELLENIFTALVELNPEQARQLLEEFQN